MKTYELTYVASPLATQEEIDAIQKYLETSIQTAEGVILNTDKSSARTLAYPVKKQISGYFGNIVFQISEEKLKEVQQKILIEKKILRHIIVVKKPAKEMKARAMRRYAFRPDLKKPAFQTTESKKVDHAPVKEEEMNQKLDEILS